GAVLHSSDGHEERASGLFSLMGDKQTKVPAAGAGDLVAIGRLEKALTGGTLATPKAVKALKTAEVLPPVYKLAIKASDRKDDVKLSGAIAKLREEDPAIGFDHIAETHEAVLTGQGEVHLRTSLARTERKFGLKLDTHAPHVGYRETIRKPTEQRGRHKKQSGGHGQFGDVVIQIKPMPRGGGFELVDKITGGVVPRNFIPSVEKGVRDYLHRGPLGFPVVDVAVTLIDGSYRHDRRHGRMQSGAARADHGGGGQHAVGFDLAHQPDHHGQTRPATRLRRAAGVAWMGCGAGAYPGIRTADLHHRA